MSGRPAGKEDDLEIDIQFFYKGAVPRIDTDNLAKPIQDALEGVVYDDDQQILKTQSEKRNIDGRFRVSGSPLALILMIQRGSEFVYVKVDHYQEDGNLP